MEQNQIKKGSIVVNPKFTRGWGRVSFLKGDTAIVTWKWGFAKHSLSDLKPICKAAA